MEDEAVTGRNRFYAWLAGIAAVGLGVRVAAVMAWFRHQSLGLGDPYYYYGQAQALVRGDGFLDPFVLKFTGRHIAAADHPPLYSLYLAVFDKLGLDTLTQARLVTCLVGVGTVVVIGLAARRMVGDRAGLLAAAVAALFPPLWMADGTLVAEGLYAFFIALALYTALRLVDSHTWWWAAALGAAIGLAALSRAEGVILVVLLAWPAAALTRAVPRSRRAALAALASVTALLVITPWAVRNLHTFEKPVILSDGAGQTMAVGNCDDTYHGEHLGYWDWSCGYKGPPGKDASVNEVRARKQAIDYMKAHKGRLPVVVAARIGRLWQVYRVRQGITLDATLERRGRPAAVLGLWGSWVAMALAAVGIWARRRDALSWVLIGSVVVSGTASAAITFGITRYRVAADVGLALFAGIGAAWLLDRLAARRTGIAVDQPGRSARPSQPAGGGPMRQCCSGAGAASRSSRRWSARSGGICER
ncbi:MAG: glycosyltransferase family 39 protein [Pseudonocardia sp.]|nr:glycosyltransferase family 39 protein [Pseudonocardia sp.]